MRRVLLTRWAGHHRIELVRESTPQDLRTNYNDLIAVRAAATRFQDYETVRKALVDTIRDLRNANKQSETTYLILVDGLYTPRISGLQNAYIQFRSQVRNLRQGANIPHNPILVTRGINRHELVTYIGGLPARIGSNRRWQTITEPGRILRLQRARRGVLFTKAVKPKADGHRWVGIEIECFYAGREDALLAMFCEHDDLAGHVQLKCDGSIRPDNGYTAAEVVVCAREEDFAAKVTKVCEVLAKVDATVNTSCGLHVHLDMRQIVPESQQFYNCPIPAVSKPITRIYDNLVAALPLMFAMQPESRRDNEFCQRNKKGVSWYMNRSKRYRAINTQSLSAHRTIEVRLGAGTVNPDKIISWVKLLLGVAYSDFRLTATPRVGDLTELGLDIAVVEWVRQRVAQHSPNAAELKPRQRRRNARVIPLTTDVAAVA